MRLGIWWQLLAMGGGRVAETEFLTIPEVAALLRIGQRTTYDLARQRKLGGAIKVGNQWRVDRAAFRRWVDQGGRSPGGGTAGVKAEGQVQR